MDEMLRDFVVEALDLASNVEAHLLNLEKYPDDKETLNAIFRSFHTIKGGAGFMSLNAMVSACHLTENLFDGLRTGEVKVTPTAIEAALQASGFVADQLTRLNNGDDPESLEAMPAALEDILTRAIAGEPAPVAAVAPVPSPAPAPIAAPVAAVAPAAAPGSGELDWLMYFNALVPVGGQAEASPTLAAAAADEQAPAETSDSDELEDLFDSISAANTAAAPAPEAAPAKDQEPAAAVAPVPAPAAPGWDGTDRRAAPAGTVKEESIRIDFAKLDALLEIAGESVQAANQGAALIEKIMQFQIDDARLATLIEALSETLNRGARHSSDLQKASLATRMEPVGRLFKKFPRLVRDLSKDLGKDIDLVITGAETEVDRVVVESLYDPLVHMLRNALDHGIETPEDRRKAGKPEKAIVSLKAWQAANSVMIELSDDGKGMDPAQLRAKAISRGLITASDALTNEAAYQLVFLPGFSTKEVASSVSGRGVGMDVVKTAVEKNRGTITIDSKLGQGTRFSIRLPIELSIVPTMLVSISNAALGIPMSLVERVVELPETFATVSGEPVMNDQGRPLPVLSLAEVLGYEVTKAQVGLVMSVRSPYILAVNTVDGTADLVIKPLKAIKAMGITGTARSAEGHLVLVVDPAFIDNGCRSTAPAIAD